MRLLGNLLLSIKDEEIKVLKQKYQRDIDTTKQEVMNQASFYNVNYENLVADYKKRNDDLERELQDLRSKINTMRYEYESLQNRCKDLEESYKDKTLDSHDELKKLKEGMKMRADQLQSLEYKLGTEQNRYETIMHENMQTVTSLKIENDSLNLKVKELEAKLTSQAKESRYELDAIQSKYNALETRIQYRNYDYSDEVNKLKETVKLKNEQLQTIELKQQTEQKLFEQIMKDNQNRINSLVAEREELTRELEEKKKLFNNELKLANQMTDASIEQLQVSLRSQIGAYQQQIAELKAELENKENVIYRIKRQNKELEMYKDAPPTPSPKLDYAETRKSSFYDKRASPAIFDDMKTRTHKEASPYERQTRRPAESSTGWRCKIQQVKSSLDDQFMNLSRYD